jgi:plasmid stabilization system protein ParE
MVFTVKWTTAASALVEEISKYLVETAGERTAIRIVDEITRRTRILSSQPTIGQREPLLEGKRYEYRRLLEGHYKIIYRVEGDTVHIVTVFDTRQNPDKLRALIRN